MSWYDAELSWYELQRFFKCWVWPAHCWRNLLFRRYDLVRLPGIKPYEYSDVTERLYLASMQLIKEFVERERPEELVVWYGDDEVSGPKWHAKDHPLFPMPEYEDKFIMDVIKEVYHWYTVTLPMQEKELSRLTDEWLYSRDGFPNYAEDIRLQAEKFEDRIEHEKQKYLHFCIELRPWLWT